LHPLLDRLAVNTLSRILVCKRRPDERLANAENSNIMQVAQGHRTQWRHTHLPLETTWNHGWMQQVVARLVYLVCSGWHLGTETWHVDAGRCLQQE
jgi:hypothetical protein